MTTTPSRRTVIGAAAGSAVVVAAGATTIGGPGSLPGAWAATPGVLDLYINEGFVPMIDGSLVYMRGYGGRPTAATDPQPSLTVSPQLFLADGRQLASRLYPTDAEAPPEGRPDPESVDAGNAGGYRVSRARWASFFPARTIIAETGSTVRLRVHNGLTGNHTLDIPGLGGPAGVSTGVIAPGAMAELTFTPTDPGTYVYSDTSNGPVERVLGLHGVLVVVAADDRWRNVSGGTEFERQWLWVCQDVDPVWGQRARAGEVIDATQTPAVPRYFMLNDRSGFRSLAMSKDPAANHAAHEDTLPSGFPRAIDVRDFSRSESHGSIGTGQLIRMVNVGVVVHQMHFHGNHVWTVRRNLTDFPRDVRLATFTEGHLSLQQWEDVVELDPLERKEILLPLKRPPESIDQVWAARTEDWTYPMHCHAEPSQTAAGGVYPGGLVAHWVLAGNTTPKHPTFRSQAEFASKQPHEGSPVTEFRQTPAKTFVRSFFNRKLRFPDGAAFEMWGFEDGSSGRRFPAPLIRITENEIAHVLLKSSKRVHTIHLHGMEPDPRNDGVGHTSFEVTGSYTYQWRPEGGEPGNPNVGAGGSYFYHCHVNTVLHTQMGMVGPMVIDPVVHPEHPVPAGARRSFVDGPLYDVATEALLLTFSVDPRWHTLDHAAGLSGEDAGLNRFDPKHFYVLGGPLAGPRSAGDVDYPKQLVVNRVGNGYPTLLRILNGDFSPMRVRFTTTSGQPVGMAELIAHDGRAFRDTSDPAAPSRPARDAGNRLVTASLSFGAAERYDMLLRPPGTGTFLAHFDWTHWVTRRLLATRTVPLIVS